MQMPNRREVRQWILSAVTVGSLLGAIGCDWAALPWSACVDGWGGVGTEPLDAGIPPDAPNDIGRPGRDAADGSSSPDAAIDGGTPPSVNYVSPYVAYLGEQQAVIIRGSGLLATAT